MFQRALVVLFPVALVAVLAGCGHDEAELLDEQPTPVEVRTVTVDAVESRRPIEVRGTVRPVREAFVSSRVTGPVVAVNVAPGERVSTGEPMVEIQPETAEGQASQAAGGLAEAEAALALAERNYERFKALHEQNAASDLELDRARAQYEQARAAVQRAQGAVRAADAVAAETDVRAPFAGRVVDTLVEVGDMAAPGRPLVHLESVAGQQIRLVVRESDIDRLRVGQEVEVSIDARPSLGPVMGTVVEIVPASDPRTHTFDVRVDLVGVELPTGLAGRATIEGDPVTRVAVPGRAVHRRGGLELVVVRTDEGLSRTVAVTTGDELGEGMVEVLSGLEPGDEVAVDAPGPLAEGTPLEVVP